ncbi:MAG TPA: inositol-3-phosphate synthase, partial [Candidatus Binataceae bacterium]|nr:inositol-3-phosphate synthase [Candidatus Binataceae bacterium]
MSIAPPEGRLGVLLPGLGAVATTFVAGVEAVKRGIGLPIGSLTQLATIRLGKRTESRTPLIRDFVPLAKLEDLEFAAWDIFEDNAYQAARKAAVLEPSLLERVREPLEALHPMDAVFDQNYVRRIHGPNIKESSSKMEKAELLMEDIRHFQKRTGVARSVMVWTGSTEVFHRPAPVHATLKAFEAGLAHNDPNIAPSQIYAYAALKSGIPYANGAPNLTTDTPALMELARERNLPIC